MGENDHEDDEGTTVIDGEEAQALFDDLLENGIKPHAKRIAEIIEAGDVAVVIYDVDAENRKFARALGWDGDKYMPVFRLPQQASNRLALADHVTAAWLQRRDPNKGRIFAIFQGGTFLVNYDPDHGYSIEPGSTDLELKQTRN